MDDEALTAAARSLLRDPGTLADAKAGFGSGNTVAGSVLSLTHRVPRQYAELAVARAVVAATRAPRRRRAPEAGRGA